MPLLNIYVFQTCLCMCVCVSERESTASQKINCKNLFIDSGKLTSNFRLSFGHQVGKDYTLAHKHDGEFTGHK